MRSNNEIKDVNEYYHALDVMPKKKKQSISLRNMIVTGIIIAACICACIYCMKEEQDPDIDANQNMNAFLGISNKNDRKILAGKLVGKERTRVAAKIPVSPEVMAILATKRERKTNAAADEEEELPPPPSADLLGTDKDDKEPEGSPKTQFNAVRGAAAAAAAFAAAERAQREGEDIQKVIQASEEQYVRDQQRKTEQTPAIWAEIMQMQTHADEQTLSTMLADTEAQEPFQRLQEAQARHRPAPTPEPEPAGVPASAQPIFARIINPYLQQPQVQSSSPHYTPSTQPET